MSESAHINDAGYVDVVAAMFRRLRLDLGGVNIPFDSREKRHDYILAAIAYLDDPDFAHWCEVCGVKPDDARAAMAAEIPSVWVEASKRGKAPPIETKPAPLFWHAETARWLPTPARAVV